MCRTSSLTLNTSWQKLIFDGTCAYNENTFGLDPATNNRMLYWDNATQMFKLISDYDYNAIMSLYLSTNTNLLTTRSVLRMRIVIPNGVSPGVPLYIPYPEQSGTGGSYMDIGEVTILSGGVNHPVVILPLKINAAIRANGFYIELQLSNALITLGTCSLTNANIRIQQ